jgi:hypothetical protein
MLHGPFSTREARVDDPTCAQRVGVVSLASRRATAASLDWEQIDSLDDSALESGLYPSVALASAK